MNGSTSLLLTIIDTCCELSDPLVHPELVPAGGVTHCNQSVNIVAQRCGFPGFNGLMANQIIDVMDSSPDWMPLSLGLAQGTANSGQLVIAGEKGSPHGHVVVVRPGIAGVSGKWPGASVPKVLNVGAQNSIGRGLNYAFQDIPRLWVWKGNDIDH